MAKPDNIWYVVADGDTMFVNTINLETLLVNFARRITEMDGPEDLPEFPPDSDIVRFLSEKDTKS